MDLRIGTEYRAFHQRIARRARETARRVLGTVQSGLRQLRSYTNRVALALVTVHEVTELGVFLPERQRGADVFIYPESPEGTTEFYHSACDGSEECFCTICVHARERDSECDCRVCGSYNSSEETLADDPEESARVFTRLLAWNRVVGTITANVRGPRNTGSAVIVRTASQGDVWTLIQTAHSADF